MDAQWTRVGGGFKNLGHFAHVIYLRSLKPERRQTIFFIFSKEYFLFPDNQDAEIQLTVWGPANTPNAIAFVYENNIYYKNTAISNAIQITTSGVDNKIFNGVPDWVYEGKILVKQIVYIFRIHMTRVGGNEFSICSYICVFVNQSVCKWPPDQTENDKNLKFGTHISLTIPKNPLFF